MGFDLVVIAVDDVSIERHQRLCKILSCEVVAGAIPLFSVPHTSHFRIAFSSPEDPSSRLPQSVQKTSDPIAAIALGMKISTILLLLAFTAYRLRPE